MYQVTRRGGDGETTISVGFCRPCLDRRVGRRRWYGLAILLLLWAPVLVYCTRVYQNRELDAYWQFAAAAPAVLIALYLSAFVYDWVLNAFRATGRYRTGQVWALQVGRRRESAESEA